ncbi:MAG: inositol polyphosphate kinase family protein [Oligoflexia bacterium]|nr:inositol polyphosphate kinase family protein [Oligoflexia bacterium]
MRKVFVLFLFFLTGLINGMDAFGASQKQEQDQEQEQEIALGDLQQCHFTENNLCQSETSGGHETTIFSTGDGFCAKKYNYNLDKNKREVQFYLEFCNPLKEPQREKKEICSFIPRFGGFCRDQEGVLYIKMENLKQGLQKVRELDVKIGKYTAVEQELVGAGMDLCQAKAKVMIHFFKDMLTTSNWRNYRIAGRSEDGDGDSEGEGEGEGKRKKSYKKKIFYRFSLGINPNASFKHFLKFDRNGLVKKCFENKLSQFAALLDKGSEFAKYDLVGASLLFIYDADAEVAAVDHACSLHLIDFAHTLINEEEESLLKRTFKIGVQNLREDWARN